MLHHENSDKCFCSNGDFNNCGQDTCLIITTLNDKKAKPWFEKNLPADSYDKIKKSIYDGKLTCLETGSELQVPVPDATAPPVAEPPQTPTGAQQLGQKGMPTRVQSAKGVEATFSQAQMDAAMAAERMRVMSLMMAQQQYNQQMLPQTQFGNYMPNMQGVPVQRQGVLPPLSPMMQNFPRGRGPPNPNPGP